MKNWKTTVAGIVAAIGTYLSGQTDPILHVVGQIIAALALVVFGATAKDHDVTGT